MESRTVLLFLAALAAVWNPSPAAAQSWNSNPSAPPSSTYDRYGQPVAPSGASITQRTQNAFTETSNAVRDGVDAGIRAAEQGINNVSGQISSPFTSSAPTNTTSTTNAGRGGVSSPWPTTNTGSALPAPAWTSGGTPPAAPPAVTTPTAPRTGPVTISAIDGGWSTINANTAPPLMTPQTTPTTTSSFGLPTTSTGRSATGTPGVGATDAQPLHSVLADPSRPATTSATAASAATASKTGPPDRWETGWSDTPQAPGATISSSSGVRDSGLVPLQSPSGTAPTGTSPTGSAATAGTRYNDGWPDSNSWAQPTQPSLGTATGATVTARPATTAGSNNNNSAPTGFASQPSGQFAGQSGFPATGGQASGPTNTAATNQGGFTNANGMANNQQQIGRGQSPPTATAEPPAWMPLILCVLGLAGSLAANLYLGVSYLDARQKYQSLVRKTADTFRRVKAVAA